MYWIKLREPIVVRNANGQPLDPDQGITVPRHNVAGIVHVEEGDAL